MLVLHMHNVRDFITSTTTITGNLNHLFVLGSLNNVQWLRGVQSAGVIGGVAIIYCVKKRSLDFQKLLKPIVKCILHQYFHTCK